MKFYKELSKVYDVVFPKDENTLEFLCKNLKVNSKILDLACGTGSYAIALAQKGHRVDAVDLGEEMINIAKSKGGLYVNFALADMTKVKEVFEGSKYDFIFCIGNSLVHLENREKVQIMLKNMHDMLNYEGSILLQIINYDRIIKYNIDSLPTINRAEKGVKFIRNYVYNEKSSKVDFNTELVISKDDKEEKLENSVELLALQSEELINMLEKAGYSNIELFGGFQGEEYNDKTTALVVRANK